DGRALLPPRRGTSTVWRIPSLDLPVCALARRPGLSPARRLRPGLRRAQRPVRWWAGLEARAVDEARLSDYPALTPKVARRMTTSSRPGAIFWTRRRASIARSRDAAAS